MSIASVSLAHPRSVVLPSVSSSATGRTRRRDARARHLLDLGPRDRDSGIVDFVAYVLASMVFYSQLRVALVRLGRIHEMAGKTEWRITARA